LLYLNIACIPYKVVEEQQVHSGKKKLTLHILEVNQLNIAMQLLSGSRGTETSTQNNFDTIILFVCGNTT
jgi:hypothetical protein